MEKKMTVPRSAVARMAPPSQPGTSTQTTVTSAGPPAAATASRRAIGSRASAMTTSSARPASASSLGSSSIGHDADGALAPASGRRPGSASRTCRRRRSRRRRAASYCSTTRLVRAGAPQTSITARLSSLGRSSGMTAAIERPNRTAYPSQGTCSERPSQPGEAVLDDERGQGQGDQGGDAVADRQAERRLGADLLDGADEHAAGAGLGVLHLAAGRRRSSSTSARTASPSPSCLRSSWRNDAASRLSRSTRIRTSSGHSSWRVSSRWAACGRTSRVVEDPVQPGRIAGSHGHSPPNSRHLTGRFPACGLDRPEIVHLQWHSEYRDVHRARHRPVLRSALPLPARRARRAGLDPVPRLEGRHRRGVGVRPVAARPLREEPQAAARAARRPRRRAVLRRPRARPGRARDHVDAGAAADDEHDGAAPWTRPVPAR